jgi:hypothetical protein
MSGNARFHDKLHRANHHTLSTGGLLDSAYDPIASPEHPFRGDFILSGSLSASGDVIANNLKIASEIIIDGNTTTQNQKIVGSLQLAKQYYGGTAIYAINPTSKPIDRTLSINYENGVYISHDLYIGRDLYGRNAYLTDLSATGVLYGNLPTVGSVTPTTEDISNAYLTLSANSGYWNDASNWVSTNSSDMVVQNLVVMNNITALGSTTLIDLSTSTSDSLCVVNVGLAVPALYAEVVLGSNPILELKHTGDGPILSAQSGGSTFLINNSGWVGIGGEPSTQLDIYPQSSNQGANVKLGGNLTKDFFINIENDELSIAHDNTVGGSFENAIKITPSNQLYVNTDTSWTNNFKLYVKNGISNFTNSTTACHTILENATYNDVYTYNNGSFVANGANTRIFNLSGENISPLPGIDANYPGWSVSLYPYVGGSVSNGFGALGQGGVASINLGYEGLQTTDNLRGSITFNTLCAISGDPAGIPERMRITPGGNVGIGINAPTTKLHILGDSDKDINFYTNGTIGTYNKLDPTYAYGFVSVNREHTLFGGNLWLSGETALPVYKKGTNDKAGAGILIKNTNGAGVIPVTKFVYALDTDDASYTVTDSMVISGTNVSIPGDLYLTGTFYGNAAYRSLTANWQSTYNTVNSNSATNWSYQGNDLKALSGNWESTYNTVSTLSTNWDSTYSTVNSNSANWSYQGNDLKALSSNWQSTYSTVSTLSAIWGNALPTDHTKWDSTYDTVSNLSSNWDSTYSTVTSNSANWSYQGNDLKALSSNWQSTYSTVTSNSANWNAVTTYVKFKSYSETSVSAAIPGTFIYTVDLSQGTVFPITLDKNITSFQLQNIPTGVNSFLMLLTQDGTGNRTVTWTFTGKIIKWSGGIPTITSTASATDIYSFMSVDGNTWYGSVAGKNFI